MNTEVFSNFAGVIELGRHIASLLERHDCVIVPGLGAFVACRVKARYEGGAMLPPARRVAFNSQLTDNDSTLVYSYVEAYDMSYPDALRRVEHEVSEMVAAIASEGFFEIDNVGILSEGGGGGYLFEPCVAGIPAREYFGLGAVPFPCLDVEETVEEPEEVVEEVEAKEASEEAVLRIPLSYVRNAVAAVVAVIASFAITTPIANSDAGYIECSVVPKTLVAVDNVSTLCGRGQSPAPTPPVPAVSQERYAVVVASMIPLGNAEAFAAQLQREGYTSTEVLIRDSIVRVVCSTHATEREAYNALNKFRNTATRPYFEEAWVLRYNN